MRLDKEKLYSGTHRRKKKVDRKFMFRMSNQQTRGHDNFTNCHDSVYSN